MNKTEIRARLEKSSLAGLVPEFTTHGEEIEFIPRDNFWSRWRVDRNWLEAVGVRVYAFPQYRKPRGNHDWRVRVMVPILDETNFQPCQTCFVEKVDMARQQNPICTPCWRRQNY